MDEVNMTKYVKRKSFTYNKGVILHMDKNDKFLYFVLKLRKSVSFKA